MSQELKAISNAKIAYLKTERLQPLWLVRCSCVEQKDCWLSDLELWCQGFNETYFGFCVFAGRGGMRSPSLDRPQPHG